MSMPKPTIDNLKVAWKRIDFDRPDKIFVVHPYIRQWIDNDLDNWLEVLSKSIDDGYTPNASTPCPAPKPGFLIRPGSVLDIEDEVVFTYLVGQLFEGIHARLIEHQGNPDIAHALSDSHDTEAWIKSDWRVWAKWREDSVGAINSAAFALTTDIVGYYDNIELSILASDLRLACGNDPHIELLMQCLNRWSQPRGRGIPQGYAASHILAKLYLLSLDSYLIDNRYQHLRYVDDIRVFCSSSIDAQRAIIDIGKFLSKRGLNLQSAKTKILNKEDALLDFDGVSTVIEDIQGKLKEELKAAISSTASAVSEFVLLQALENSANPPTELLEKAFNDHIINGNFDKTLFHYLLTRLGKAKSPIAVNYCIDSLSIKPDETGPILRYLSSIELSDDQYSNIANYFQSDSCIYDYQKYQLMKWSCDLSNIHSSLLAIARQWAFDGSLPEYVRSFSIAVLGNAAIDHDLEVIEAQYDMQLSDISKADCAFACRSQEKSRRNTFYAKAINDGYVIQRAIETAKAI